MIMTVATFKPLLVLAFSAVTIAFPSQSGQTLHGRVRSSPTIQPSATCVAGGPANTSAYESRYAKVTAPISGVGYDIDPSFSSDHAFWTVMDLYVKYGGGMDEYASFKCQYACNGIPGCVSFFGRFVHVNSWMEHFECLSFDTLLSNTSFALSTRNIANGGYNKLCG